MFRSYSLRLEITVIELSFSNCLSRCRCVWYSVFKVQISVHIFRYLLWLIFINRMETTRFELVTPCLQGRCSPNWAIPPYGITAFRLMGLNGLEPSTSRLSGVRSNQLSYRPIVVEVKGVEPLTPCVQGKCSPNWAIPPQVIEQSNDRSKLNRN